VNKFFRSLIFSLIHPVIKAQAEGREVRSHIGAISKDFQEDFHFEMQHFSAER